MTFDRKEWAAREKPVRKSQAPLHQIIQAAPKMQALTGSPQWDTFLSYFQAQIEIANKSIDTLTMQLLSPSLWDPTEMVRIKAAIISLQDRVATLTTVLELPKKIIESGKTAEELLVAPEDKPVIVSST